MTREYDKFLESKATVDMPTGFEPESLNPMLFEFQRDITMWAIRRGRACIFADCGLGKTPMQLAWADAVRKKHGDVLIVAPLAVSSQTIQEGVKFGIEVEYSRTGDKSKCGITITNYEMLHHFSPDEYAGVVLDESSILKSYTGKIRTEIIDMFVSTPYKLACTATPSPNDLMELGNHAEFVGAMSRTEMLSMFFVHDGGETQSWRLKGHAIDAFWKWVCSWSVMLRAPSDLGYDDDRFLLPPLNIHQIVVEVDHSAAQETLFIMEAQSLQERQHARRISIRERCNCAAAMANELDEPVILWCDRNDESRTLAAMVDGAKEITGSDSVEHKTSSMIGFSNGDIQKLVTKPTIAGFGMNWQHCSKVFFVGLSDSYEQFYQAVRRTWRFGQTKPVECYIITSEIEGAVVQNIKRKESLAKKMADGMLQHMRVYNTESMHHTRRDVTLYEPERTITVPAWMETQS